MGIMLGILGLYVIRNKKTEKQNVVSPLLQCTTSGCWARVHSSAPSVLKPADYIMVDALCWCVNECTFVSTHEGVGALI